MKKLFSLVLMFLVVLGIAGCNEEADSIQVELVVFGEVIEADIYYEDEETLLEVLKTALDVRYDVHPDFGAMVHGIEGLEAVEGSYISFLKNGELAMQGVSSIDFETGDRFRFELAWFDQVAQVDYIIDLFVERHVEGYLESHNYYVYAGLYLLGAVDDYAVEAIDSVGETAGELVQAIFVRGALGLDTTDWEDALALQATSAYLYSGALYSMGLNSEVFDAELRDAVEGVESVSELDIDTLSLIIMALNKMDSDADVDGLIDVLADVLYESEYGENAATFSHALMAMVSTDGVQPNAERFQQDGVDFIQVLLSYHYGNGSFYYQLGDDIPDMTFTTPQVFLSLAMLKVSLETEAQVIPFVFE